jgi:sterol desaturase/sphingolipid hydroxylase (fatty acid hydroxylase superfamily)
MATRKHANVRLPAGIDRALPWPVVTPDTHRVHHSVEDDETSSDFGFNLSGWGRLPGTCRDQPRGGHEGMTIGLGGLRGPRRAKRLPGVPAPRFSATVEGYAINRRRWGG